MHRSGSHHPVIHFYDDGGNATETHEHAGISKSPGSFTDRSGTACDADAQLPATNEVQEWAEASVTAWTLV
jgi:hypothetical protein